MFVFFFFQAEDGIRDDLVTGVQTCALPISIGAAGLPALLDLRGNPDLFGRTLQVSISGFADEIAAAASLVQGQGNEAQPVILVRGLAWTAPDNPASELVRPAAEDMFR